MIGAGLSRLPPLAATGVGSLPHEDVEAAVRHATRAYELPFCPQLPRHDGNMIAEWLGGDPGRCGWAPDRDRERPAAWDAFHAEMVSDPPVHRVVKLQVTGPLTLAAALERTVGRPGAGRDAHHLAAEIAHWLAANLSPQRQALASLGLQTLLVIDEPGLAAAGLPDTSVDVWDPLRRSADAWGLHVCGAVPWRLVDAAAPDVLSFDLRHDPPTDEACATLQRLTARGGRLIWGVVDPVRPAGPEQVAGLLSIVLASLAGAASAAQVASASLVSPACGTGRLAPDSERLVAVTLSAARDAVRRALSAFPGAAPPART